MCCGRALPSGGKPVDLERLRHQQHLTAIEAKQPNRARAVLWYLNHPQPEQGHTKAELMRLRVKQPELLEPSRHGHVGHPARQSRAMRRSRQPSMAYEEQETRRKIRELLEGGLDQDGLIRAFIRAAAQNAARQNAERYDLEGEEHANALTEYFYGIMGESVHRFDPALAPREFFAELPGYYDWRKPPAGNS